MKSLKMDDLFGEESDIQNMNDALFYLLFLHIIVTLESVFNIFYKDKEYELCTTK